mgnify:CR=1 FL=1
MNMQLTDKQGDQSVGQRVRRILTGARLVVPLAALGAGLLLVLLVAAAMAAGIGDGRLDLGTRPVEGDSILLTIADNGPGVPARARDNLFQAFKGGARKGGSGLGLAISAGIAQDLGGRLVARNHAGGGACFELYLPALQDMETAAENNRTAYSDSCFHGAGQRGFSRPGIL